MSSSPNSTDAPVHYCDLVMKGGITSGVVYPLAITELSRKYLFKNIGGTSVGAVAAAITAAAEYGRRKGNPDAYERLAALPKDLGTNNLLLNLFEPTTAAVRIFRVVLAALKAKSTATPIRSRPRTAGSAASCSGYPGPSAPIATHCAAGTCSPF